jgi:hypothetical protein
MKTSMLVKCEKCGYENFPQHRFCGMCAAPLPIPMPPSARPTPVPPAQVPRPASRPLPVALEREPVDVRSLSYLLEDEPPPSHRGKYFLALILLLAALALVGWHWRDDLGSLISRFSSGAGSSAPPNASAPAADAGSAAVPATATNPDAQAPKPVTGTDQASAGQTQTPAPAASGTADPLQGPQSDQSQPSSSSAASAPADSSDTASQTAPAPKTAKPRTQPTAAARADDLEAEGEKYLYGNGVPENCTRARTNLLAAAQHSNAQAQNVLGTMYATGHCATRDLPTAYRWFSRSLRKDPSNTRIEQDLKVLWNQMTPEERQLALRDER